MDNCTLQRRAHLKLKKESHRIAELKKQLRLMRANIKTNPESIKWHAHHSGSALNAAPYSSAFSNQK